MQIGKDTVVTISYELFSRDGELIEETEEAVSYLHGGYAGIFPPVEEALEGHVTGYACRVDLEADDAFGEYEEELVRNEPRALFPPDVRAGMQFEGAAEDDEEDTLVYTVREVTDEHVVVDGNHPLAGQPLIFACTVTGVRKASGEELRHGHVHGAHGHEH